MVKVEDLAFVFPGQGSQFVGMLDVWQQEPAAQQILTQVKQELGAAAEDLLTLISQGPKEELSLTTNTQPAMLLADVIAYRVWQSKTQLQPQFMAGHSLGEYAALVCAEAISLGTALRLVMARAQAMQQAVPVGEGTMAAILGLPAEEVVQLCQRLSEQDGSLTVEAVNFNEPRQTVIAGHVKLVEAACAAAKESGARRALLLPVSGPFHSRLMKPAAQNLLAQLQQAAIARPQVKVVNNVDVAVETEPQRIKDALYRQIFNPVQWTQIILKMQDSGVKTIVECGAGKALSGMVKRIAPQLGVANIASSADIEQLKQVVISN